MTSSTTKTLENLKNNIRKFRKQLKLTQLQLAVRTGLSKDFIYSLEAGKRKPKLDVLCNLADALKVEPYELLK